MRKLRQRQRRKGLSQTFRSSQSTAAANVGWIVGSSVYSVNSYGYDNQPDVMYGPYQGSVAQSLYNAAAAG